MNANASRVAVVNQLARQLIHVEHPQAPAIRERQQALNDAWTRLRDKVTRVRRDAAGALRRAVTPSLNGPSPSPPRRSRRRTSSDRRRACRRSTSSAARPSPGSRTRRGSCNRPTTWRWISTVRYQCDRNIFFVLTCAECLYLPAKSAVRRYVTPTDIRFILSLWNCNGPD